MKILTIPVTLLFFCNCLHAQQSLTNTGTLQIHTGGSVSSLGGFDNTSAGSLVVNGDLYVSGTLSNSQSSMSAGTGTLYLNGSSAQTVDGTQPFKTNNLVTNNGAGITLNNNLSVAGVHTFTNGLIHTSGTTNYLVYEAGSSHTGSTDSRHVTGWVKKIGTTSFTFPVGDATYQRTLAISSLSASSEFDCHYFIPTANIFNMTSPVVQVRGNEYWQLDKVAGGTARVTLNWDHSKVAMNNILVPDILVGHYTGGSWTDAGGAGTATGTVTTTGSVTSAVLSTFSPFTLAYKSFPVPLQMISFAADRRTGTSYLNWVTDNEQNVSHFEVQRSYDAMNYSPIGSVAARNSGSQERYAYEDRSSLNGFAWYRIRSVDIDGKFSYTKVAVVSETAAQSNSFVVMNPVHTAITVLNRTGNEGVFNYRLFTTAGQLLVKGNITLANNSAAVLPLPGQVAAGIYILELSNEKIQFRQKVLVEK